MHCSAELSSLIALIYDAALDPARWAAFLTALAEAIHGTTTVLIVQDLEAGGGNVASAIRLDAPLQREYEEYYADKNLWLIKGRPLLKPGKVVTGPMVCSDAEFARTEYCNDYLRPLDLFHAFGAVAQSDRSATSILSSFRPKRDRAFDGEDVRLLERRR